MGLLTKARKYIAVAYGRPPGAPPRQLILFVTSTCNQHCDHCFYAESLNQRDDLSLEDIRGISCELDRVDTLLVSGGEPFLRRELPAILKQFYDHNGTRKFSIPTNASKSDRILPAIAEVRRECPDAVIDLYVSFDGLAETHERIRKQRNAFETSMKSCETLLERFAGDPMVRFQVTSVVMDRNVAELEGLARYVRERFRGRLGIGFAFLRGKPKDVSLQLPPPGELRALHESAESRYSQGSMLANVIMKAMLEIKIRILTTGRQPFQCLGGDLLGVVYANGDVASCELLPVVGNVRKQGGFRAVWGSAEAEAQKASIRRRECACTHECFITPSLLYHRLGPLLLAHYYLRGRIRELGTWALRGLRKHPVPVARPVPVTAAVGAEPAQALVPQAPARGGLRVLDER